MASIRSPLESLPLDLVEGLFNHLPSAPFFVKDADLCYVAANDAMLRLCGVRHRRDLLGRTAREFFPESAQRRYEGLDRLVIRTKRPIADKLDFLLARGQGPIWLLFTRWPVLGRDGAVLGVAASARKLKAPDRRHPTYQRMASAVADMQANFSLPLQLGGLARAAGVSVSQFERDFAGLFGLSPHQYLTKVRMDAAMRALRGAASIAAIAQECGYADQSAFTRRFTATVGLAPMQYRRSLERSSC